MINHQAPQSWGFLFVGLMVILEIMKKIILDLILIILSPFMLGGIILLVSFHFLIFKNELGHPYFGFILIKLMLLDLFCLAYLTLFYKRIKSEYGFNQTKEFIINRKIIYSIIKVIDWIFARLFIFIIPIFILCMCIIFIDGVYQMITKGYGSLEIGNLPVKIASLCMFYPLIYLWRFLIKKVLRL